MNGAYLRTENLSVGYQGRALIEHIALSLRRGEIMTLIGPNGSGKSTILRSIIRQLRLIGGTVYLDGRSMAGMTEIEIAKMLSVLMTDRIRPELMRCEDVVATGRYPYTGRLGILSAADWDRVHESMELVHAAELAKQDFSRISDGQRQRVLLARAVCQEPEIIVLDEPTSFLDIRHKLELLAILKDMVRKKDLAVLMSLHELDLAQKASDYVVCVQGNRIGRCGPPEEIFTSESIAELFGASRGSYNANFGSLELERVTGTPEVFVIGGGGSGIPVYRRLQRRGIPFAAGVLHQNDIDFPVAQTLAVNLTVEKPFCPISDETLEHAKTSMASCGKVLCPLEHAGPMNERNLELRGLAEKNGWLVNQI